MPLVKKSSQDKKIFFEILLADSMGITEDRVTFKKD